MSSFSDEEIIHAIRQGQDAKVIESLYATLLPKVKKHIRSNNGSLDDAYDVFQDAVMVFYRLVVTEKFDSSKYKIQGFVFTISKNLWVNLVKKRASTQNREQVVAGEELESSILDAIIRNEKKKAWDQVFELLGDKCKEILVMFYYHRFSLKEIAQKLGYTSEDSVKVKSHRCKKTLADVIKDNRYLMEQLRH